MSQQLYRLDEFQLETANRQMSRDGEPVFTLDICGYEMTYSVTERTAGLV